ncbi:hypothetical protein GCM10022419_097370 [Nonomuraea rosea]|uniref:Methyltransferase domain-containing protein n=1 Tax=Nonomuraea rosea TaxID=638574 RepID=A0ABP6Z5W1_9ACTN
MSQGTGGAGLPGRVRELAASFQDPDVVAAYVHRPPYPAEVFDILESLMAGGPRRVLDLGAGEGALARPLAARVDHVDAVEISPAMVAAGRSRPGGDRPNLSWHVEAAETMSVRGPYALVTAGASLHWMDWEPTLARAAGLLAPGAFVAIVDQHHLQLEWRDALREVIVRHSRNPGYDPAFSLPDELSRLGLFEIRGRRETAPTVFRQPMDDYIEHFHSTASLARALMPPQEAAEFRAEVEDVVGEHRDANGELVLRTAASIVWGLVVPQQPAGQP